jgi:pyruvate/2-oxoglutarate dehydrogenase complex dihydrolipoamide dehydrogenase (E3) component
MSSIGERSMMRRNYDYDVIVVGGGAAGLSAAITAAGFKKKTLLVERRRTGGECTWFGCIPSKALIKNAHVAHDTARFMERGFYSDACTLSDTKPLEAMREVIHAVYGEEDAQALGKRGIEVLQATAQILDRHTLRTADRTITGGRVILALGTSPFIPQIEGLTAENCLTNESVFSLEKTPESMLVLGGGPIGVELSQAFNRLGTKVTLVENTDCLLPREDPEMAHLLESLLIEEGVLIIHGRKAVGYRESGSGIELDVISTDGARSTLSAEKFLCSVGRVPNTQGIGLQEAGIKFNNKGIVVNRFMCTSLPGVYACGDIVGKYQFSHIAGRQGIIAAMNALLPIKKAMDYSTVLWTTFADPEFARIGMTEAEAKKRYGVAAIRVIRIPYTQIDRAKTELRTEGMAKFVLTKRNKILGAHILGVSAGELIHEVALLRKLKKPLSFARKYIHAYPTYSELLAKAGQAAFLARLFEHPLVRLFRKESKA